MMFRSFVFLVAASAVLAVSNTASAVLVNAEALGGSGTELTSPGPAESGVGNGNNPAAVLDISDGEFTGGFGAAPNDFGSYVVNVWHTEEIGTLTGGANGDYFADGGGDYVPVVLLDLGSAQTFDALAIWNNGFASPTGNAAQTVEFRFGASAAAAAAASPTALTLANSGNLVQQDFSLGGLVTAQFVELTITDNYGGNRVGLADVQFNAVPEPSSFCAMLVGLSVVALHRKRLRG